MPGFQIRESELAPADLEESDCVFITSTTRDLLPVLEIDGVALQPDLSKLLPLQAGVSRVPGKVRAESEGRKQSSGCMKPSLFRCENCGSSRVRRSQRRTFASLHPHARSAVTNCTAWTASIDSGQISSWSRKSFTQNAPNAWR